MRHQLTLFLTALGFFTRIPVLAWITRSPEHLKDSARYLPLVGWVIGAAGAAIFALVVQILPLSLAVLLSMTATIQLTGAFHEDGWADTCDGLGGGMDRSRILAIMKDSAIGVYGTIGIVLMLLIKAAALFELAALSHTVVMTALVSAHALSRLAAAVLMHTLGYARDDASSKSRPISGQLTGHGLLIAALCGLLPLFTLFNVATSLVVLTATLATTVWFARMLNRRLGGYTGDTLGAVQQGTELICYLGILTAWNFT